MTEEEKECARPPPLQLSDLELIRILGTSYLASYCAKHCCLIRWKQSGKGAFGSVGVVKVMKRSPKHQNDVPGAQMALKIFKKDQLRKDAPSKDARNENEPTVSDWLNLERRNLATLEWNPFIAGLYTCLQDSKNLYQLMELGHLGSLAKLITDKGALQTSVCRFYFANLVSVTEFLHGIGLIHSDLKPENIVIGADGYLMVCDVGISAYRTEKRNWNLVGTTAYTSPEALRGLVKPNIAESVDWWAVGCILFEMATGRAVFRYLKGNTSGEQTQERKLELVRRVCACQWWWPRGVKVDPELKNLVDLMLHKEFELRLGSVVGVPEEGSGPLKNEEIRAHPFLRTFPWKKLNERALAAPFVPVRMPDLSQEWHAKPMPEQQDVPAVKCVEPAPHVKWDARFRRKKDVGRLERDEVKEWNKMQERWNYDTPQASTVTRIAALKASPIDNGDSSDSFGGSGSQSTGARVRAAQAALQRVNQALKADNPAPNTQPQVQAASSSEPPPPTDATGGLSPRSPPPPAAAAVVFKPTFTLGNTPLDELLAGWRERMAKAKEEGFPPPYNPIENNIFLQNRQQRLPASSTDFNMPEQVFRREITFKKPMLPERVLFDEFSKLEVGSQDVSQPQDSGSASSGEGADA
ncbi:kinase-like domain-containing protein [Cytidiella melzeri]|nr:kinase-like domain-containing protein [Cytidiella melzeri]